MKSLRRMWIDQPSLIQSLHHLHGTNVLAYEIRENIYRVYFLTGDIIDMEVMSICLSEGWINNW